MNPKRGERRRSRTHRRLGVRGYGVLLWQALFAGCSLLAFFRAFSAIIAALVDGLCGRFAMRVSLDRLGVSTK